MFVNISASVIIIKRVDFDFGDVFYSSDFKSIDILALIDHVYWLYMIDDITCRCWHRAWLSASCVVTDILL